MIVDDVDGLPCKAAEIGEGTLSRVLKDACAELGCSRNDLTVLSAQRDAALAIRA